MFALSKLSLYLTLTQLLQLFVIALKLVFAHIYLYGLLNSSFGDYIWSYKAYQKWNSLVSLLYCLATCNALSTSELNRWTVVFQHLLFLQLPPPPPSPSQEELPQIGEDLEEEGPITTPRKRSYSPQRAEEEAALLKHEHQEISDTVRKQSILPPLHYVLKCTQRHLIFPLGHSMWRWGCALYM